MSSASLILIFIPRWREGRGRGRERRRKGRQRRTGRERGVREGEATASCLRDIVEVMKGQNVSEMRGEKRMKALQRKKK